MELFEINDSNIGILLETFGKEIDPNGIIIDKATKEQVRCKYTNNILTKKNLGGILPGSNIFIENSDIAYARYIMEVLTVNNEQ